MKKVILSGVIAFAATSALAQAVVHEEYYVVRDPATKKCIIVDQKPTRYDHHRRRWNRL
jgi:hypothetical protein